MSKPAKPINVAFVQFACRLIGAAGLVLGPFGLIVAVGMYSPELAIPCFLAILSGLMAAVFDLAIEYAACINHNTGVAAEALTKIVESQSRKKSA